MLPWLLLAGALAGGAALWYFFRKKKKPELPPPPPEPSQEDSDIEPAPEPEPIDIRKRNADTIDKIVARLQFAVGQVIHKSVKTGEEMRPSIVPADDIVIRPMRGVGEIPRILSSAHATDDDSFYAGVAANQHPVIEHQERVDILEDIEEPSRNIVIIIQDVSPSMKDYDRMGWAIALDKKIIAKAQAQKAEVALLPFGGYFAPWLIARTDEERLHLMQTLEHQLHYISSTDIDRALIEGIRFLSDPSFTERKIVLVTDGTQSVSIDFLRKALAEIGAELHTVCIGPQNAELEALSTHYDYLGDVT